MATFDANGHLYVSALSEAVVVLKTGQGNTQQMELSDGYQFISSYMEATNPDMLILNDNLINNESPGFVRNSSGNMLPKIGPNWVNNIDQVMATLYKK